MNSERLESLGYRSFLSGPVHVRTPSCPDGTFRTFRHYLC